MFRVTRDKDVFESQLLVANKADILENTVFHAVSYIYIKIIFVHLMNKVHLLK